MLLALIMPCAVQAQEKVEMADVMRSEGKIYVVVAIILLVLAGLIAYLFLLDRKVKKLERMVDGKKQ
jgi:hypothetical protein